MSQFLPKGVPVSCDGVFDTLTISVQDNNYSAYNPIDGKRFFNIHNNEDYYTFLDLPADSFAVYDKFGVAQLMDNGATVLTSDPFTALAANIDGSKLICYQAVTDVIVIYDLVSHTLLSTFTTGQVNPAVGAESHISFCDDETQCFVYRNVIDGVIVHLNDDGTLVKTISMIATIIAMQTYYGASKTLVALSDQTIVEVEHTISAMSTRATTDGAMTNTPLPSFYKNTWLINTTGFSPVLYDADTLSLKPAPTFPEACSAVMGYNDLIYQAGTTLSVYHKDLSGGYEKLESGCYFSGNAPLLGVWLGNETRKVSVTVDTTDLSETNIYIEIYDAVNRIKRHIQKIDVSVSPVVVDLDTGDTTPVDITIRGGYYPTLKRGANVYKDEVYISYNTLNRLRVTTSGMTSLQFPIVDDINPTTDGSAVFTPIGKVATSTCITRLIPA